jgi:competence protein CoiA
MLYAVSRDNQRIIADKGVTGYCPSCGEKLLPKCGDIITHHWAHQSGTDCDSWSEPESEWHLAWKELAGAEHCEIKMDNHRADIVGRNGVVIELQHSSLSWDDVSEREEFYGEMVWVIDAEEFWDRIEIKQGQVVHPFVFHRPRKWLYAITRPMFLDYGYNNLFQIISLEETEYEYTRTVWQNGLPKQITTDAHGCEGKGRYVAREEFIRMYFPKKQPKQNQLELFG